MSVNKKILTICVLISLFLAFYSFLVMSASRTQVITEREVLVQLNVLKMKHNDQARGLLSGHDKDLSIAGGFSWQNRVIVPLILKSADSIVSLFGPQDNVAALRVFYSALLLCSLFLMYMVVYYFCYTFFGLQGLFSHFIVLAFALMISVVASAPPGLRLAGNYLEITLFMLIIVLIYQRKLIPVIITTALMSLVKESAVFVGLLYYAMNVPKLTLNSASLRKLFNPKLIGISLSLIVMVLFLVIGIRAFFLGGLSYALGIGIQAFGTEAYDKVVLSRPIAALSPLARNSWFLLLSLLLVSIFGLLGQNEPKKIMIFPALLAFLGIFVAMQGRSWQIVLMLGALFSLFSIIGLKVRSDSLSLRMVIAGSLILMITLFFGYFTETRVFLPCLAVLLFPFANTVKKIFVDQKMELTT